MILTEGDLKRTIEQLRADGSDLFDIEVKHASGGMPRLAQTLCAFANMPEGGVIILGLDESSGFTATGVPDPAALEEAIASQSHQQLDPKIQVQFSRTTFEGKKLVLARVHGLPSHQKPCRVISSQKAYLRFADGDYVLSEQEIHQILSARERPRHDVIPIDDTSLEDLDPELTQQFLRTARLTSKRLAREDDQEVLRMKRIVEPNGERLTVAGLYALGRYPQQFLPSMSLTAVLRSATEPDIRNADREEFDGPLPEILDNAVQWVMRNIRTKVRFGADGHGYNTTELPVVAVREIIANALVHRDLSQHTWGKDVQLILDNDRLVVVNPGGLWGLTTDQLGHGNAKSAVNEFLYDICQLTTTSEGHRVIEREGGGLREVYRTLRRVGMKEPQFHDLGVRFTVILPRHTLLSEEDLEWLGALTNNQRLTDIQRQVLASMRRGQPWTNEKVRREFGPLDSQEARLLLQELVALGLATTEGSGRWTRYRLPDTPLSPPDDYNVLPFHMWTPVHREVSGVDKKGSSDPTKLKVEATSKHGLVIWQELSSGPKSVHDLSATTDLNPSQIRYGL